MRQINPPSRRKADPGDVVPRRQVRAGEEPGSARWRTAGVMPPSRIPQQAPSLVNGRKGDDDQAHAAPGISRARSLPAQMTEAAMYKHILISTDGSEIGQKGVDHGLALAKNVGAKVTLVTVSEPFPIYAGAAAGPGWLPPPMATAEYEASQKVDLELRREDAPIGREGAEGGVAGRTVGDRTHRPGMDEAMLLRDLRLRYQHDLGSARRDGAEPGAERVHEALPGEAGTDALVDAGFVGGHSGVPFGAGDLSPDAVARGRCSRAAPNPIGSLPLSNRKVGSGAAAAGLRYRTTRTGTGL